MDVTNIPYQSFCWVIGTTSFRVARLNLRIEEQLLLLNEFQNDYVADHGTWSWDSESQAEYYDFMKSRGFLTGDASLKAKDAREKTSGLVDIGLLTSERIITEAGRELLAITESADFGTREPRFNIARDSFAYFKQLLKTTIKVNNDLVRPYIILAKALVELGSLSYDEFMYVLPLAITADTTTKIVDEIRKLRQGATTIDDIIFDHLMSMSNYQLAWQTFAKNDVSEEVVCLVGMNRKSRSYDKPYYQLYKALKSVFLEGQETAHELYVATRGINQKPGVMWRSLLFDTSNGASIKKRGKGALKRSPFSGCQSEEQLKRVFFKYLHVFKAKATLSDYFDLNRRYFSITDTLIFEDQTVRFDLIPKHFFASCIDSIFEEAFEESTELTKSVPLEEISSGLVFNEQEIYATISEELGVSVQTTEQLHQLVRDDRYRRFEALIDKKFPPSVLEELLTCFETRNDSRIEELVTDDATVPTIFEYILAIIWYRVSENQGDILDYMKLSLDAGLLPRSHATGGTADIVYEYDHCEFYPRHSLLLEATLAQASNQRRQEMEPVSRHLGEHLLESGNCHDYCLFVSTYLHPNVVSDFRTRKHMQYFSSDSERHINGMKIMSIDTSDLKMILKNEIKYKHLYAIFERYHRSDTPLPGWRESLSRELQVESEQA